MKLVPFLIVLCFGIILVQPVMAQTTTASIEGTVKDPQGNLVAGAQITAKSEALGIERSTTSDEQGFYRLTALPAGTYSLAAAHTGFATQTFPTVELTVNRTIRLEIQLEVGPVQERVSITSDTLAIDPTTPATGATITPRQITEMPVNGRNYLDLLQLVPGVVINHQANQGSDNSTPVLGERAGNNNFMIDGQPNKNTVTGGAAAQFNQETIAEFQVLTAGYKAEFGQASGAIVNVITRSGGNGLHGIGSIFHRNNAFDASNSLTDGEDAPELRRYDYSLALGGPIVKDRVFFFGSGERITERRVLNFTFPSTGSPQADQILRDFETPFDNPSRTYETRGFFKLDEQLGRHRLSQEVNYTNGVVREFLPLSAANSLPSRRNDTSARSLLLGFSDLILLGNQANPWVLNLRGGPTSRRRIRKPVSARHFKSLVRSRPAALAATSDPCSSATRKRRRCWTRSTPRSRRTRANSSTRTISNLVMLFSAPLSTASNHKYSNCNSSQLLTTSKPLDRSTPAFSPS
jgi:hypothetical protein